MKTIEEKAKAYDEALGRARELVAKWTGKNKDFYIGDYSYIFPELAESEDEKIRRTLVEYFGPEAQLDFVRGVPIQKIRDWLERQKEQKVSRLHPEDYPMTPGECIKPAWSEEDYFAYSIILNEYKQMYEGRATSLTRDDIVAGYNFLKSLRPSWKPSEKDMNTIGLAIQVLNSSGYNSLCCKLNALRDDFLKLK